MSRTPAIRSAALFITGIMALHAQTPSTSDSRTEATFRADSQEVLVRAAVSDRKGTMPRDLTQRDFKILEDGREQRISSFSQESQGGSAHSRRFVALLFETDNPKLRDAAVQFVDSNVKPDLYVAIYARVSKEIHLQQGFTSDPERLRTALRTMQVIEFDNGAAARAAGSTRQAQAGPLAHLAGISELAADLASLRGRKVLIELGWNSTSIRAVGGGALRDQRSGVWVKPFPWPTPEVAALAGVVDAANQANVSVYSFGTGDEKLSVGDYANRPDSPEDDRGAALNVMQDLAARTGGRFTLLETNALSAYLGGIAAEQGNDYMLGFIPLAASTAKPCHTLKVTVNRKGLDVNAREGYCTSGVPDASGARPQKALEARMADGNAGTVRAGLQLPWFYSSDNVPLVEIAMDIDPAEIKVKGLRGQIDLLGIAYRPDGTVAARVGDTVNLEFETKEQLNVFLKTPFHYTNDFSIPPGSYNFRMAVALGDRAYGSVSKPLEIEPWGGGTLAVSALALSDDDRPLPVLTAGVDSEFLEGPRRLASQGRETVPMGGTEFNKSGLAFFYFEVYAPGAPTVGRPPAMRIRVLDRATGEEKENSGTMDTAPWVQPGNRVLPIALTLPIERLPAGDYILEVRVSQEGRKDAVRTAVFGVR